MNRDQFILTNQDKEPVNPHTGYRIDPHDPASWMSRDEAQRLADAAGLEVAYVITADEPTACIDIDGCRDPITGAYDERAQRVFAALPGVGVEISRSERGLHFWFCCEAGMDERFMNRANGIEFYQSGRYIILGSAFQGDPSIDATPYLPTILTPRETGAETALPASGPVPEYTGPSDDALLIQMALGARGSVAGMFGDKARFPDLWNGSDALGRFFPTDTDDPFDRSAADAALLAHLAFWTGKDQERMRRLWLISPLARGRTDQKKLQRTDYQSRSIGGAVRKCQGVYSKPPLPGIPTANPPGSDQQDAPLPGGQLPESSGGYLTMFDQDAHFDGCVYVRDEHKILAPDGDLLKPEQFRVEYGGYEFQMQADGARPTRDAWECFTQSRCKRFPKVRRRRLLPNKPFGHIEDEAVNVFKCPDWRATEVVTDADVAPYLDLVRKLLPDPTDRSIFLTWCASMVQNPGLKFQWALVLQGTEGNGKTFLLRCMTHAVGEQFTHLPNPEDMNEKFNTYLDGNLLIGVEEVHMAGRRDMLDRLKKYITNDRVEIRGMGQNKRMGDNLTNWMFLTNHQDAVIKTKNDRRYAILYTAQQQVEDLARDGMNGMYFPQLWDWARAGGFEKVAAWLHRMPLDARYNPAGECNRAPDTTSTAAAITNSMGPLEQELREAIDEGVPGFRGSWISSAMAQERLKNAGFTKVAPKTLSQCIEALGYSRCRMNSSGRANPIPQEGGKRPVLYRKSTLSNEDQGQADYEAAQGYNFPGQK
ncbi:DUF5906 domain-containing protein [Aliiroseovarius sp. S1123]|uniref:phage NrS-1 polymerase family protein n=1 Tax=Aliiroseovarius sp. S1123 TaxID=2926404 RepID=UPI001FF44D60|nr:DUF5906 domain-containing protein [Aliiroseovarius sp. S1123]MCK0172523.1 DUF5906 domain-containing protein [Aliiroseovarius sp. S1123]